MMARTQIVLDPEVHKRVRHRASDAGISLAEYVRRLVERDLAAPTTSTGVEAVFDLGSSAGSDIAKQKRAMIADAFADLRARRQRREQAR